MKVRELIAALEKCHSEAEVEMEIVLTRRSPFLERSRSAFGEVTSVMYDDPGKTEPTWGWSVLLLDRHGRTGSNSLASRF